MGVTTSSRLKTTVGILAVAVLSSGCSFLLPRVGGGGGSAPCHEGTWELTGQQISEVVTSIFGDLSVTPDNDGMTLELRADGTFTFSGEQSLGVSGSTPFGSVDGTVGADATANGTYVAGAGTLNFVLQSIAGSANFTGTVNGQPFSGSLSLAQSGLDDVYGLSGAAAMSCTSAGLTLGFDTIDWDF